VERLDFKLNAKNSSGVQTLELVKDDGEFWFVLFGEYEGREIQIDFDELTRGDLEDMGAAIQLILDAP
jgi:hypothetical protein